MLAVQMQAMFADCGIDSEVFGGTAGGVLPQFSGSQGFKLVMDVKFWDRAVEIEKQVNDQGETAH